ncbi:MAG TPA: YfhO family protein, partial [Chitinophagaceae bacterium]|nr:YfhO family protein [Chitinophagaceae bacterium]
LFVLGMVLLRDWNKWWLLAVSIFGILLAWGSNFSWLNYFLFEHLPYYNKFRAPTMALFIPQLTFPLTAGLALQQLFFGDTSREELWKKLKLAGIITGAVLLVLIIMYFSSDYSGSRDAQLKEGLSGSLLQGLSRGQQPTPQVQQQAEELTRGMMSSIRDDRRSLFGKDLLRSIVLIGIAFGLLWAYVMQKLKKREYVLAGLLVLGAFDLLQVDRRYLSSDNYAEAEQSQDNFPATAADLEIKKDTGYYRVLDQSGGNPFVDPRASYFHNSLGGYSPAKLGLYQDIIEHQLRKSNMQVYNMLNTKYFIVQNPANGQPMAQLNPGALGAAWFVKGIVFARNADDEMRRLDNLNTKDSAVIDERFRPQVTTQPVYDSTAFIRLEWNKNDSIQYVSASSTPQFAVFSEIYYPFGWNAYIDGKETDHVRVNYLLRGMPIPAGRHTIDFRFEPKTYYTGNKISLWVNILMCFLLLGGIGLSVWKKKT